jgi:hypothetical protein
MPVTTRWKKREEGSVSTKENEPPVQTSSVRDSSPEVPLSDWELSQPPSHASPPTSPATSAELEEEAIGPAARTRRGRASNWSAWEDRALAIEVLNRRPWTGEFGPQPVVWNIIAESIKKANSKFTRTGSSCKNRLMGILIPAQKVQCSKEFSYSYF